MWTVIMASLVPISAALLIGVLTGWWAWGRRGDATAYEAKRDSDT